MQRRIAEFLKRFLPSYRIISVTVCSCVLVTFQNIEYRWRFTAKIMYYTQSALMPGRADPDDTKNVTPVCLNCQCALLRSF